MVKYQLSIAEAILKQEENRKFDMERRLLVLATIACIAGLGILIILLFFVAENPAANYWWVRFIVVGGCLYLLLQLTAVLRATIIGLTIDLRMNGQQSYRRYQRLHRRHQPGRSPNETSDASLKYKSLYDNFNIDKIYDALDNSTIIHRKNSKKSEQLDIAYRAMMNFSWVFLWVGLFAGLASIILSPSLSCVPACQTTILLPPAAPFIAAPFSETQFEGGFLSMFLMGLAFSIFTLGISIFVLGKTMTHKLIGSAMMLSSIFIGLTGKAKFDTTLFQIDKLIGELQLKINLAPTPRPQDVFIRRIVTLGPFADGDHLLEEQSAVRCVQRALANYDKVKIGGWEVIGRVDKRQLKPQKMGIYGSNQALAMARASWVVQKILTPQPAFKVEHSIISVGGAQGIGTSVGVSDMQYDRAVDVFVIINWHGDPQGLAALPAPVVCH